MSNLVRRNTGLFDELFNDITSGFFVRPLHGEPLPSASQIKIDVQENANGFEVNAEIPGVNKEDIDISVDGAVVTISAEVAQQDSQEAEGKVLRSERYFGSVSRSFQLPTDVDTDACEAAYENGVLKLTLPKLQGSAAKKLTVK